MIRPLFDTFPTIYVHTDIIPQLQNVISYRYQMEVTEVRLFRSGTSYAVCPRCDASLEREYMQFCNCCGQYLGWKRFNQAVTKVDPIIQQHRG